MYLDELFGLKGKVAVVTGAARGIGQVVARGLSAAGAEIAIIDLAEASETVSLILKDGGKAYSLIADVTDETQVDAAVHDILERSGSIGILFNNAGICLHKPVLEATIDEWRHVVDVNLTGEYIVARAVGRAMIGRGIRGSIINMASMSGTIVNVPQRQASYNASKAAVMHLTKSLALEWADHGIRVNSLSPGYINTPMAARVSQDLKDAWLPLFPMHRMGQPEELVGAVIYLASGASSYTTGHDLIVDGGYTCR
jgi:sorbose reductase